MEIGINARLAPALILLLAAHGAPLADEKDNRVEAMLAVMVGSYQSDPATAADEELPNLLDRRVRVAAPELGEHVVYWQLNSGTDQELYRQRVLAFSAVPDSEYIIQTTWSLAEPERFVDAFDQPERFAGLTGDDVEATLPNGCDQIWQKTEDGWYGRVSPDTCRVWSERRQMWRRIGAEAMILPDAYWQAERGFDDDGVQLFGTKPGEFYHLQRIAPE